MNVYLAVRLRSGATRSLFEAFAERFALEQLSEREATVQWNGLLPEGAPRRPPAKTTLFTGDVDATWTIGALYVTGPPTLARWSNLFRIASVGMELVRRDISTSWKLWTEIVALDDHPDDGYALALYPPRETKNDIRCGGASFHRFAPVLGMEQLDQLRLNVSLDEHPLITNNDSFDLRRLNGHDYGVH